MTLVLRWHLVTGIDVGFAGPDALVAELGPIACVIGPPGPPGQDGQDGEDGDAIIPANIDGGFF